MSDVPGSAWEAHLQAQQQMTEELRAAHAARILEKDERIQELLREVTRLRDTGEEEKRRLEEKLEKMQGKYDEDLRTAQAHHREEKIRLEAQHREEKSQLETRLAAAHQQHREEKSRLEAQLAAALGRNERLLQAFQEGVARESRERDDMRETAERNQRDLALEWRDRLEGEQERWAAERARLSGRIQELEARPDALAPALADVATYQRLIAGHLMLPAALGEIASEEQRARAQLQAEEGAARRALEQQRDESLKQLPESDRAKAVFAARGLSMKKLCRTHLGKGPATINDSYAAGEGLYNLFLALRPGGPIDGFAMRVLLKGETNVIYVLYNTQGQGDEWSGEHFTIPAVHAYELAACVLCHLPALKELAFQYLPPLSTNSLEWVSHLPQGMSALYFMHTDYTVADLRELHCRRRGRTFRVNVRRSDCTNWGEFAGVVNVDTKSARVKEELGGMVVWWP